jgi:transcriptional regulator with XRE-family HTH domain
MSEADLTAFVSIPMTSLEGDVRRYILFLSNFIERVCKEQGFKTYVAYRFFDPKKRPEVPSSTVHFEDRKSLMNSDVVIMYLGKPSHGVGDEYEIAFQACIPVIFLIEKGQKISRMINGGFANKVDTIEFEDPEDLEQRLSALLKVLRPELLQRRFLFSETKTYAKNVGERIAEIRQLRGMSRQELADRAGLPVSYVKELEKDAYTTSPSLHILYRISRALEVSPSYVVDPDISREILLNIESMKTLSEFAREYNISYREYEELLAIAAQCPKRTKFIGKREWHDLYYLMKQKQNNMGERNGQKKLEEFFG